MECEHCHHVLTSLSSLKHHQLTAKYCLVKQNKEPVKEHICSFCGTAFVVKSTLNSHLRICKANTPVVQEQLQLLDENSRELVITKQKLLVFEKMIFDKDLVFEKMICDKDLVISEQKIIIKELQEQYKSHIEMQNKDLQDRIQSMAEKAISKPSSVNQNTTNIINNLVPITTEHMQDQVEYLTKEHVKHGAIGYAKYALEFPLKDRLVCTDVSRMKGKYKDADGNIIDDPEMSNITKKLFLAIKDRNAQLIDEHALDLRAKLTEFNSSSNNEMDEKETIEFSDATNTLVDYITGAYSQKRQSREMSEGLKPELFQQFVKELATGSYRSKSS